MEQVYWLTNTFIDLIIRDQVLPATINISTIRSAVRGGLEDTVDLVKTHWQDLLLQYVGLLTAVIVGLLTALCLPVVGEQLVLSLRLPVCQSLRKRTPAPCPLSLL